MSLSFRLLRLVGDCLPSVSMTAAVGILLLAVWQVVGALETSHRVHVLRESIVASIVAEEAAFEALKLMQARSGDGDGDGDGAPRAWTWVMSLGLESPTGFESKVEARTVGGQRMLRIQVLASDHRRHEFSCEVLLGSGPANLGFPLSVVASAMTSRPDLQAWLVGDPGFDVKLIHTIESFSEFLFTESVARMAPTPMYGLQAILEDQSIGLLQLPTGTDRRDYVLLADESGVCRLEAPADGLLVLDGHLWVERKGPPLWLELDRSLTIVARGNLYLGRSIQVRGRGKLSLTALRSRSELFRDLDADGRWSKGDILLTGDAYRGPVEGTGAVYLGLPLEAPAPASLEVAATLVAEGELHLLARNCEVRGALVVGQGITRSPGASLRLPGDLLPNVQREPLPGFRHRGILRPGLLRRIR